MEAIKVTASAAQPLPKKRVNRRQSFYKAAWLLYGLACMFPYLVGIYLFLELKVNITYTVINILGMTLVLILLGAMLIEIFARRLRHLSRIIAKTVIDGSSEKLPTQENDLEEVYTLTRDFNTIINEVEQHKSHSKKITAKMLSYVNDLDGYEKKLRDELLIRANLSRYVGKDVVDELVRSEHAGFENVQCTATILFADIRQFTTISEDMEPEETISMLNDYFEEMVPIVFKYGGTLDKFVGDELMAVFRDHPYGERAPVRAIRTGIEMIDAIQHVKPQSKHEISNLEVGIGINTGKVVIGNVGSENRKDYTAIGDTVNVAARFEQLATGQEIIVGENTYQACKELISMQPTGEMVLKNRKSPVQAYRVILDGQ
ncbi:MAG: adenylate/guanylate cyclase domain-containing protein [Mariprofundaceae bacterium]